VAVICPVRLENLTCLPFPYLSFSPMGRLDETPDSLIARGVPLRGTLRGVLRGVCSI